MDSKSLWGTKLLSALNVRYRSAGSWEIGYLRPQINSDQEAFLVLFPKVKAGDKNNLMRSNCSNTIRESPSYCTVVEAHQWCRNLENRKKWQKWCYNYYIIVKSWHCSSSHPPNTSSAPDIVICKRKEKKNPSITSKSMFFTEIQQQHLQTSSFGIKQHILLVWVGRFWLLLFCVNVPRSVWECFK